MKLFVQKYKVRLLTAVIVLLSASLLALLSHMGSDLRKGSINTGVSEAPVVSGTEFAAFINSNIIVGENGKANLLIQNNENNHASCRVSVFTSDHRLVYESDIIPTGYYIEDSRLFEALPMGMHDGYAIFEILDGAGGVKSTIRIDVCITVRDGALQDG